jgi:CspA family cold shock protein
VHVVHQGREGREGLIMQGVVKVYDSTTGIGVIRRDDGDEIQLRPGSLQGSPFRMLRQGQRVVFDTSEVDGALVAGNLRFGADGR